MKRFRRNESGKKLASRAGARAVLWLLLPILVFVVLNADYMPQVPRLTETSVTEADIYRQSVPKDSSSGGLESAIWEQQQRLLHDVAKLRSAHDPVVEAPPSLESSHEVPGKGVGANKGKESSIWQQQKQLLLEIAQLRAAQKELLLEVAKLRAAHDLHVKSHLRSVSSNETPGEVFGAPPSPASSDEKPNKVVDAPPSPTSSDETSGKVVDAPPSPSSSDEKFDEAVEAPPSPTSSDETPDEAANAPPSPSSNEKSDETSGETVEAPPSPASSGETSNEAGEGGVVEAPPSPASTDETLRDVVDANKDVAAPRSKANCDFRSGRMDICAMEGDVRMHGKAATVYVVSASDDSYRPENGTVKIHPYTRKWEPQTMQTTREVTIRWSDPPGPEAPQCTVTHDVPAVVFSTGGYLSNFFHAMTDGVIPLFNTAREYEGRVQLVATDFDRKWVDKFRDILAALSNYPVIDFDADDEVRCFPSVHVGTESHKELGIIPALSRKGYTMTDFRDFLRSAYSLKREWSAPVNPSSGDRPRLVMVLRRRSREIANEAEAIAAATEVGFEVVSAGPEVVSDMAGFAEVVNSCDVILGVHGAGLTNLLFLPRNATVMQIVPWGDMRWASYSAFGQPTADMDLRYVEYEATEEETTLKYVYPRDHVVFTDPRSLHRQGFNVAWGTFLEGQNVTLDIGRFRWVLQQIYRTCIDDPSFNSENPAVEALPTSNDGTPSDVVDANKDLKDENVGVDGSSIKSDVAGAPRSKASCDFRSYRMDICAIEGDVRIHGKAASVYVVSASDDSYRPENGTVKIHPYPRKWEARTSQTTREVTIHWSDPPGPEAPQCTVTHDVPAVVFSTGGYLTNFFHAMTDGIVPLFNTAREYGGRVQLVATDYDPEWIAKFRDIFAALSIYPIIDFDADDEVRCFPSVRVGTESHKELGIIPAQSRKGYTMTDFRDFLRSAYSLKREWSTPVNPNSGERPRLVMVQRRKSRAFVNEAEAVAVATEVGFEVVSAGPEVVSDMARFAEVVNSCDVILGVHGAGLANLVFLPRNATVMQIVPWGDLKWASYSAFGEPTPDMGLRYVEYEANAEETTLKYIYPRDHAVFTDPASIHWQGFRIMWETFLNGQNVTLDIDRFRGVLQHIYDYSVTQVADPNSDQGVEAPPSPTSSDQKSGEVVDVNRDVAASRSKASCDFRSERMDICAMEGDVRMHGKAAAVYVVSASDDSYRPENGTVKIHPYTRKWEPQTMQTTREVTIHWSDPPGPEAPQCTVTHDVPAVVFSTGGYLANFFHAMTDGIVPLFNTAREYGGRVQLVATDYDPKWIGKFKDVFAALSIYPIIDFDADDEVRCFPSIRVGTESHKELGIIPALSRKGYTMTDFRDFLRSAYSLKREWSTPVNPSSGERPRLVMILRRRSREIANEAEAIAAATEVGFEVVPAGPEAVSNMAWFAEVVNSCDVIMGVHGAGLTNLVFLPRNATVMQIVPWGDMRWASYSAFGQPTADMGLRYVEYEANAEETTLKYNYPRDHAIFTDPASIHKQGFGMMWETFLNGQNVTLDINRFKGVLQHIYDYSVIHVADPNSDQGDQAPPSPASGDETPGEVVEAPPSPASSDQTSSSEVVHVNRDVVAPRSKASCDFRSERMDICAMEGDVRMHGKAATVYVVSASGDSYRPENGTVKIHPYPRKWEPRTMQIIREVTIRWSDPPGPDAPQCTVTHDVPAIIFSSGGYLTNFFHAMTDGIVPLFNTAREYGGRVQLVATDYDPKWIGKFRDILAALSIYPVLDFDADDEVRCFPSVHVGTESHKELGIIPALSRKGYTMTDFREFLRSAYSLKREWSTPVNRTSGDRPRLVMVLRRRSREIANEADAIAAATEVGFEVVSAGPEAVSNMAWFAEVVNSCDVMLGVHGAGLTNLVFLPRNATVMQIVPWGDMRWASNSAFGEPTPDMGLRYVEYEANAEETTLKYIYPRDHAVFTDPGSIHKQGFGMMWETFLNGQNVTLDIDRFKGVLNYIYHFVTIT